MSFDISFLWIWLVLAAAVGAAVGWRSHDPGPQTSVIVGWVRTAAIVWVIAAVASILHIFGGRTAFWLESAVLFSAAYVVGALIGGALRARRVEA